MGHDQYPAVSPDGAAVAFDSSRACNVDVFVIPLTGETTAAGRPAQCAASGMGQANLFAPLAETIPLQAYVASDSWSPLPGPVS